jgi:hypothetical protein
MHAHSPVWGDPLWLLSVWRGGQGIDWDIPHRLFPQIKAHR